MAAKAFDSEEEAREAALKALASMRAEGHLSEAEYQERRRRVVGTPVDLPIAVIDESSPAYPQRRGNWSEESRRSGRSDERPKSGLILLVLILLAMPLGWLGYSYVVESGPFARKRPDPQTRPTAPSRPPAPAAVAAQPQVDHRSSFIKFGPCIGGQLVGDAANTPSWWIDASSVSFDLRQTSSLLNPVEGVMVCEMRSVAQGRYIATIRFIPQDKSWRAGGFEVRFNGSDRRESDVGAARALLDQWLKDLDYAKCE